MKVVPDSNVIDKSFNPKKWGVFHAVFLHIDRHIVCCYLVFSLVPESLCLETGEAKMATMILLLPEKDIIVDEVYSRTK